jgi:hypothetical protein
MGPLERASKTFLGRIVTGSREPLRAELVRRLDDYKNRLIDDPDPELRGRAKELKALISELEPPKSNEL